MYKLVVVDDEDIVRNGIINGSPLSDLGFEVVADASNGLEAIEKIEQYHPDVVLTDIRMPQMSGIELIEHISRDYPNIKIVILSGYSEVEYLKQAIKNKVEDYLLKPTCMEEFHDVFKRLKDSLDEEKQKYEEYNKLKKQLIESLPYMREKYLNQLVKGYYSSLEEIEEKNKFYEVELAGDRFAIVLLEIDNYHIISKEYTEEKRQLLMLSIIHIANQILDEVKLGVFFLGNNNEVIGICNFDAGIKTITSILQEIQKTVFEYKKLTVSAGISKEFADIRKIEISYKQALEAIKQKVFLGNESVVFYQDIENMAGSGSVQCAFDNESIINAIYYDNRIDLEELLSDVFKQFECKILKHYEYIDKLCLELLFCVSRYAQQFNIRVEDILESKNTAFLDIYKLDSLDSKKSWLYEILHEICKRIGNLRGDYTNRIIEEAKAYIKSNFSNNNISLDQIAEKVNKNAGYLSKLFKVETGENYVEYLTKLRMERAKELLTDISIKTYEISSMVGYADVSHFNRMFKKHMGFSPSEYRELISNAHKADK